MAEASTKAFEVSKLRLQQAHLSRLVLEDILPLINSAPSYQFKTTCSILFSPEQPDLLRVNVQVRAAARSATGPKAAKAVARLEAAIIFSYADLAGLRQQGGLPVSLGWTAVSIAYSTVRGMFQARLAGTSFAEALLPIISPQDLWQPPAAAGPPATEQP